MNWLDKETFEQWMERAMERFDRHDKLLAAIAQKKINSLDGEPLFHDNSIHNRKFPLI